MNAPYGRAMFSGPRFRSVRSVRTEADRADATLSVPAPDPFLTSTPPPRFLIDPVLLDGAGQVIGFWTAARLPERFVIFPVGVD